MRYFSTNLIFDTIATYYILRGCCFNMNSLLPSHHIGKIRNCCFSSAREFTRSLWTFFFFVCHSTHSQYINNSLFLAKFTLYIHSILARLVTIASLNSDSSDRDYIHNVRLRLDLNAYRQCFRLLINRICYGRISIVKQTQLHAFFVCVKIIRC